MDLTLDACLHDVDIPLPIPFSF